MDRDEAIALTTNINKALLSENEGQHPRSDADQPEVFGKSYKQIMKAVASPLDACFCVNF